MTPASGGSSTNRLMGEYLAASLAKIGVQIDVHLNTIPLFISKMQKGDLTFFNGGWYAGNPDPTAILRFGYGKNIVPGPNTFNWQNPAFDALYDRFQGMVPSPERTSLVAEAETLMLEDAPIIPLYHPVLYSLQHGWVRNGFMKNPYAQNSMKYLDIDLVEKKRTLSLLR